ncbi:MAG TPA: hypothetical protein VNP03_17060 [Pseudonocardia sp.]|nr:hypothetical protein [Pseudonocardia sp.]
MKIVHFDEHSWAKDHPSGTLRFQHLLKGDPESPDNFMYVLAKQDAEWSMPRHRHNFDQIRLPLVGSNTTYGRGVEVPEGQVGYFPEGLSYGPQESPMEGMAPGQPLMLTLQFGGASGYGFMSIEQRRQARDELIRAGGRFDGPYYVRPNGTRQWGLNTIWEHVFGDRLKYPRSRYSHPVIADPKRFNWLPIEGARGVHHKYLGSFSERGVWVEFLRLHPGARWSSVDPAARRLLVVLSGAGECAGAGIEYLTAVQSEPGELLSLAATPDSTLELFLVGLPPVVLPETESAEYDVDPAPDQAAEPVRSASRAG